MAGILRRLAESVVTFVLVTIVVFLGVRALPGDPARALAGEESDPATVEAVRHSFGLDQPIPVQYVNYVGNALTATSAAPPAPGCRWPARSGTRSRSPCSWPCSPSLIAALIGVGAGVVAAVRRRGPAEWAANSVALIGLSVPNFWLGLMARAGLRHRLPGPAGVRVRVRASTIRWRASGTC